jgi:hypothetical protein
MSSKKNHRIQVTQYRYQILEERGSLCEWCHERPWTELHHCLIHRKKGFQQLDHPYNLMAVCKICHESGEVNNFSARVVFYLVQILRGCDIEKWLSELPLKIKPNFSRYKWKNPEFSASFQLLEEPLRSLVPQIQSD